MKLPNLSIPVIRSVHEKFTLAGLNPSGIACRICHAACNAMAPGIPRDLCNMACTKSPACS